MGAGGRTRARRSFSGELLLIDRELVRSFRHRGLDDFVLFVAAGNIEQQREFSLLPNVVGSDPCREAAHELTACRIAELTRDRDLNLNTDPI